MRSVHALLLFLSASAVFAQQEPHLYSISGRLVLDSGEPVPNAEIMPTHHGFDEAGEPVLTDAQGHFSLTNLPAGQYILNAQRRDIGSFFYGQSPQPGIVNGLNLNEKWPHQEVLFRISLPATVEGNVRNAEGAPLSNIQVVAKRRGWTNGKTHTFQAGFAITDELGHYRLNVTRGRYRLCAKPTPNNFPLPVGYSTFGQESQHEVYVETCQPDTGSGLLLSPGQKATVDIIPKTKAGVNVSGRVTNAPANISFGIHLQPLGEGTIDEFSASVANTTHEFQFQNIQPGQYWLSAQASFVENGVSKSLLIHQALSVPESGVSDLNLTLSSPPSVNLVIHSLKNAKPVTIGLRSLDDPDWQPTTATSNPDGSLQIPLAHAGLFWLTSRTSDVCIASARYGSINALTNPINVPWDSHETLEVTTTNQCGGFKLKVTDEQGNPTARSRLLLLLSGTASNPGDVYLCSPDPDGTYSFESLRPGSYPVWVWSEDDEWNGLIGDLANLQARQATVVVKASETTIVALQTKGVQ